MDKSPGKYSSALSSDGTLSGKYNFCGHALFAAGVFRQVQFHRHSQGYFFSGKYNSASLGLFSGKYNSTLLVLRGCGAVPAFEEGGTRPSSWPGLADFARAPGCLAVSERHILSADCLFHKNTRALRLLLLASSTTNRESLARAIPNEEEEKSHCGRIYGLCVGVVR